MKILGAVVYLMGFLGIGFIITETGINLGDSFGGILLIFGWLALTMGIGSVLMKSGENNDKQD